MARIAQQSIGTLLDPAVAIVRRSGLGGLSLRTLAQALGVSVSPITSLAGTKAQLLERLIAEAQARDAARMTPLLALAEASAPNSTAALAALADLVLESHAEDAPGLQVFWCEFVQAAATQPDIARAMQSWFAAERRFWHRLSATTGTAHAPLLGDALFGLSIDERAHATALQPIAAYRQLRRLCLDRLCRLDFSGRDARHEAVLFDHLVTKLGEMDDSIGIDRETAPVIDPKQMKLAAAAAQLLVYDGAGELTHRAVAARAGVAVSTLAYHFRTREDLLAGAMRVIIQRLKNSIFAPGLPPPPGEGEHPGYNIARSTFTLALEASRSPAYLASAADMRRKRGVNLVHQLNARFAPPQQVDALGAQALSIVGIGAMLAQASAGIDAAGEGSTGLMNRLLEA